MSQVELIFGDCLEKMPEIPNQSIDMILTDPPYGVNFKSFYNDTKKYVFGEIDKWYSVFFDLLKIGKYLFIFVPVLEIHKWIESGIKNGFIFKNIIATKTHFIGKPKLKNNFSFEFQPIVVFSKNKSQKLNDYDFIPTSTSWLNDKRNKNKKSFTYLYPNYIDKDICFSNTKSTKNNSIKLERHPNEKNIKMLEFLVGISTNSNDIVLDPFMGSGTTGVACKNLNRNFIGIEFDKKYFEDAKQRIERIKI
jgi:DNA modification methylase